MKNNGDYYFIITIKKNEHINIIIVKLLNNIIVNKKRT